MSVKVAATWPADQRAAGEARAMLERTLEEAGVAEDRRFEALVVASELVANAVTHGSGPGDEISFDVSLEGTLLRIAVADAAGALGPGRVDPG